jgi:hypothetical protein
MKRCGKSWGECADETFPAPPPCAAVGVIFAAGFGNAGLIRREIERIPYLTLEACRWVDTLSYELQDIFRRGYELIYDRTGIHLKGPVMELNFEILRMLIIDGGGDPILVNSYTDDQLGELVELMKDATGYVSWQKKREYDIAEDKVMQGSDVIASRLANPPQCDLVDHGCKLLVPGPARELVELDTLLDPVATWRVKSGEGAFFPTGSIGLRTWSDAVSRCLPLGDVLITKYSAREFPMVHEFWKARGDVKVEARSITSHIFFHGYRRG